MYATQFFLFIATTFADLMSSGSGRTDWMLTWSDEFSGPVGSEPDSCNWGYDIGDKHNGWGNSERQYYTSERNNSALDGTGNLVITAAKIDDRDMVCYYGQCEYKSARLLTINKFEQQYGKFEARIKTPTGKGVWPAFWMLGNDIHNISWPGCGEVDIMELKGSKPGTVASTLHGPGYSGGDGPSTSYTLPDDRSIADDFHVFSLEWSDQKMSWKVDDHEYHVETKGEGRLKDKTWVFDHPFFLVMNVAIGGHYDGAPDASTVFPQRMVIDYIRVYRQCN